ncbi:MAG: OmpA family protein [Gammaproteobacteria bacterium]|nr:OmpA family protein [Gammaproteobacteria bacterium]MBQ0840822.1 OmpA family protein [Gammaproteobacteria bacterium]
MGKLKTIGAVGAVLLASSLSTNVNAAEGLYVGGSVTGYYLDSERFVGGGEETYVAGFNLGYRFADSWALEAGYGTEIGGNAIDTLRIDALYFLGENAKGWNPYIVAGVAHYELNDSDYKFSEVNQEYTEQLSLGMGLSKMLEPQWEFRSDVRVLHKISDHQDGVDDLALNLAVNYYFNPPAKPMVVAEPEPTPVAIAPPPPPPVAEPEVRTITVRLNVEFEFDKAIVRAIYGDELEAIANAMKAHDDIDLVLEGHTDSVGTDDYNQSLSERRVVAVEAKLAEMYGLDPERVSTVGYGEARPIADNNTKEGRARNRRVIGELSYSEVFGD